jgi:hypothetical protein
VVREHAPADLLTVKGIAAAQRFRLADDAPAITKPDGVPGVARYLALYELDTEDTAAVLEGWHALHLRAGGRGFDALELVAMTTGTALAPRQTSA